MREKSILDHIEEKLPLFIIGFMSLGAFASISDTSTQSKAAFSRALTAYRRNYMQQPTKNQIYKQNGGPITLAPSVTAKQLPQKVHLYGPVTLEQVCTVAKEAFSDKKYHVVCGREEEIKEQNGCREITTGFHPRTLPCPAYKPSLDLGNGRRFTVFDISRDKVPISPSKFKEVLEIYTSKVEQR